MARAEGLDEPARWAQVVEAWKKVGHVPNLAWALLRLGAAHVQAGNREEAVEPLSEALRIAGALGTHVSDSAVDLARRSRLRLDSPPRRSQVVARPGSVDSRLASSRCFG